MENVLRGWVGTLGLMLLWPCQAPADDARPDVAAIEAFEKEVRPILATRCLSCHDAAKARGGLRLDSRAAVLKGGASGAAVVPGKPEESLLIEAIHYDGDVVKMPPKSKLPDKEIEALSRWVAKGVPWGVEVPSAGIAENPKLAPVPGEVMKQRAKFWSFQPVKNPAAPVVKDKGWPHNPVDAFLLARLEKEGLKPAPEADRRTLIRRLSFDLIGLPPTPDEVKAFVEDKRPDAYERLVDRLLASPHYGERQARHWLDLVRYAETAGHEFDYDIQGAYHYRDYLIRAFNLDLPYDRFVVEQIAGDLLETPRLDPTTHQNDSVIGTASLWLGEGTHSPVDSREDTARRVDNQIDVLGKAFLGLTISCARCHDHKFDAITAKDYYALAGYFWSTRPQQAFLDPPGKIRAKAEAIDTLKGEIRGILKPQSPKSEAKPATDETVFERFDGPEFDGWSVTGDAFGKGPTQTDDLALRPNGPAAVWKGMAHSGLVSDRLQGVLRSKTFAITSNYIQIRAAGTTGQINVVVDGFDKNRSPIYGGLIPSVKHGDELRWIVVDVAAWKGHEAFIEIADGSSVNYNGGQSFRNDGGGWVAVDEIRFSDHSAPNDNAPAHVAVDGSKAKPLIEQARAIEREIPSPTLALAAADGSGQDVKIHLRGSTKSLGELAPRRFLEAVSGPKSMADGPGSGRLALAKTLIEPSNPFLSRVLVNRLWKQHFGEGLVKTPDDFGAMGRAPTHPELLDWLATRLVSSGWSVKAMHRLLVTSRAYRMSSHSGLDPDAESKDPTNALLHRMPLRRLDAESLRDAMLAVSGRLDPTMFGPGVPPYLTPFMEGRGRPRESGPLDGNGRRSIYLNVRRNFLNPFFLAFDTPAPASTMGRRNTSNVPAQALALWNDPFVQDQSKRFAARVRGIRSSDLEKVAAMYELAFGRPATSDESAQALEFVATDHANPSRAWQDLAHVMFNVKEFLYVP